MLAGGPLPVPRAVAIAREVCAALAAAHGAGILHRDIKPANLIFTPDGTVKVCDFGIAQSPVAAALTEEGMVQGTSEYLAPERASGGHGDHRSDLYGLGCVLYEMLAGTPPFTAPVPVRVLYQHLHQPPRPLADLRDDVPPALDQLVLDLLAKDPADRPASAAEVAGRLDERDRATVVLPVAARRHRRAASPRPTWWIAAAVVAALLLAGLAAVLLPTGRPAGSARQLGGPPVLLDPIGSPEPAPSDTPPSMAPSGMPAPGMPTPSPANPSTPPNLSLAGRIAALGTLIARQAAAGQLDAQAATQLGTSLNDVARRLDKGQTGLAASRVTRLRDQLTVLAADAHVTSSGYQILAAAVDQLASAMAVRTAR
jgi:serine/threonine-protein kinase